MEPTQPKLNYDRLRDKRKTFVKEIRKRPVKEAIEEFSNLSGFKAMVSTTMHALEWDEEEIKLVETIVSEAEKNTTPQESARDFLLLSLFMPQHHIPFQENLEYLPDEILSIVVENIFQPVEFYHDQIEVEKKGERICRAFQYLAKRLELDPHSEQTSPLAILALKGHDISPCLNLADKDWQDLMNARARVYIHLLSLKDIPIEPKDSTKEVPTIPGRVGIFCSHLWDGPSTTLAICLLEALKPTKAETYFICDSAVDKTIQKLAEELADNTVILPTAIIDACESIRKRGFETLIFTEALHDSLSPAFLLGIQKLAKNQVVMDTTLTATGFDNLKNLLTCTNPSNPDEAENEIHVKGLASALARGLTTKDDVEKSSRKELGIQEEDTIFTSAADLLTITPEVRECWMEVLKQNPDTKLLLFPFNDPDIPEDQRQLFVQVMEMEANNAGIPKSRLLIMTDTIPTNVHLENLLSLGNIYLDTFPVSNLNPAAIALRSGLPVVTKKGKTRRENLVATLLEEQGNPVEAADSNEEYVEIAGRLAIKPIEVTFTPTSLEPLAEAVLSINNN